MENFWKSEKTGPFSSDTEQNLKGQRKKRGSITLKMKYQAEV
jgi:hypothetical protein